jgi:hypothetical protein
MKAVWHGLQCSSINKYNSLDQHVHQAAQHLAFKRRACSRTCATSWGFFSKKPHASLIFNSSLDSTDGSPQCTWQQQHDEHQ